MWLHRSGHDRGWELGVIHSKDVPDLMKGDRLDIEPIDYQPSNKPMRLLIVEVHRPGQRVVKNSATRGEVGVRDQLASHVGVAAFSVRPRDPDVRALAGTDLSKSDRNGC
jgi:hypothetical protein